MELRQVASLTASLITLLGCSSHSQQPIAAMATPPPAQLMFMHSATYVGTFRSSHGRQRTKWRLERPIKDVIRDATREFNPAAGWKTKRIDGDLVFYTNEPKRMVLLIDGELNAAADRVLHEGSVTTITTEGY